MNKTDKTPPPKGANKYYICELSGGYYIDGVLKGFAHVEYDLEQDKEVLKITPLWSCKEFIEKHL